jgi:flagellum-specific peptidoglycan hydrolase FlgJ
MGYTKDRYTEPEAYQPQRRFRRSNSSLGRVVNQPKKKMPFVVSLQQSWQRLKRSIVALRFQFNRYTLGIFQKQAILKIGFLIAASYFIFFSEEGRQFMGNSPEPIEQGVITPIEAPEEPTGELSKPSIPHKKTARSKQTAEPAPAEPTEVVPAEVKNYVERFRDVAIKEMKKFGIPASISLAQGLIESRAGTSKLAVQNNNHFGIKCFSRNCKKGHCTNFTDDSHKDFFRKFNKPWESWRAHSQLLASGRYAKLKNYGRDYRKWAYGLEAAGYASDRKYAEKLIGIIERYDLHTYDR